MAPAKEFAPALRFCFPILNTNKMQQQLIYVNKMQQQLIYVNKMQQQLIYVNKMQQQLIYVNKMQQQLNSLLISRGNVACERNC